MNKKKLNFSKKGGLTFIYVKEAGIYCNASSNVQKVMRKENGYCYFDTSDDFKEAMKKYRDMKISKKYAEQLKKGMGTPSIQ